MEPELRDLLRGLTSAAGALGHGDDVDALLRVAVEQMARVFGASNIRVYLREGDGFAGAFSVQDLTGPAQPLKAPLPEHLQPPRTWFETLSSGGERWTLVEGADASGGTGTVVTAVMTEDQPAPLALLVHDAPAGDPASDGLRQEVLVLFADLLARDLARCDSRRQALRAEATARRNERLESMAGMAGILAHDLNNLLMPVIGYSKLIADSVEEDDALHTEAVEILRAAEEVSELATRLLGVGRRRMRQLGVSDLRRIVAERQAALEESLGGGIRLSIATARDLPLIQADPDTLFEVLRNLLLNAREALPEGGDVRIEAEPCQLGDTYCEAHVQVRPGSYVRITVEDNGPGMTPDVAAHAFDPFFTTKKQRGAGLGLPTVYGAVRQCGGCVDLVSRPGKGTRVEIMLPPALADAGVQVKTPSRPLAQGAATVLVVEDEDRVRRVVVHMLETLGYHVLDASGGPQALEAARAHPGRLDLVLTDVVMPGMDGRETVEQLRRLRRDFRALYMSGYADADLGDPHLDVLRKPFTAQMLDARLRDVLNG